MTLFLPVVSVTFLLVFTINPWLLKDPERNGHLLTSVRLTQFFYTLYKSIKKTPLQIIQVTYTKNKPKILQMHWNFIIESEVTIHVTETYINLMINLMTKICFFYIRGDVRH